MKSKRIALILLLLCAAVVGNTVRATTVVYPTGVFPTDVQNVQAAIDQGGTVLLKATDSVGHPLAFNFGTPQHLPPSRFVLIQNDVSILGEVVGMSRTTISGGSTSFRVVGGRNSITGLKFDGALVAAIHIFTSSGTSIIGNEINNVVPDPLPAGFTQGDGIDIYSQSGFPADISGNLVISGNTFGDLTGNFALAIQIDSVAANVTISDNTFWLGQLASDPGFINSGAIVCARCHSVVTISGNVIAFGPGFVLGGITTAGGPDARYHVFGNTINTQSPVADGIDIIGITGDPGVTESAVVEGNSINLLNSDIQEGSGIALLGTVTNSTIQGNTVTGNGQAALAALGLFAPGEQVSNNRFLNNDISQLAPSVASIFLDQQSANNLVRGQCVSVLDLGLGNDISCSQ